MTTLAGTEIRIDQELDTLMKRQLPMLRTILNQEGGPKYCLDKIQPHLERHPGDLRVIKFLDKLSGALDRDYRKEVLAITPQTIWTRALLDSREPSLLLDLVEQAVSRKDQPVALWAFEELIVPIAGRFRNELANPRFLKRLENLLVETGKINGDHAAIESCFTGYISRNPNDDSVIKLQRDVSARLAQRFFQDVTVRAAKGTEQAVGAVARGELARGARITELEKVISSWNTGTGLPELQGAITDLIGLYAQGKDFRKCDALGERAEKAGIVNDPIQLALLEAEIKEGKSPPPEKALRRAELLHEKNKTVDTAIDYARLLARNDEAGKGIIVLQAVKPDKRFTDYNIALAGCFVRIRQFTTAELCLSDARKALLPDNTDAAKVAYGFAKLYLSRDKTGDKPLLLNELLTVLAYDLNFADGKAKELFLKQASRPSTKTDGWIGTEITPDFTGVQEGLDISSMAQVAAARGRLGAQDQFNLAITLLRSGQNVEAIAPLQKGIQGTDPKIRQSSLLLASAVIAADAQLPEVGVALIGRLSALERPVIDPLLIDYYHGRILETAGRSKEALSAYAKIQKVKFDFKDVTKRMEAIESN